MTDILQAFVDSLPDDVTVGIEPGMKDMRVICILSERGVQLPADVSNALEQLRADRLNHEAIMDSMRPFEGNNPEDFPTIIRG